MPVKDYVNMTETAGKAIPRPDEWHLVERLKKGDAAAFKLIVESRKDLVYNTAIGLLQNAEDAEDITQEVFVKVFESIHQFKGESAFSNSGEGGFMPRVPEEPLFLTRIEAITN